MGRNRTREVSLFVFPQHDAHWYEVALPMPEAVQRGLARLEAAAWEGVLGYAFERIREHKTANHMA
jgi:hypothetical protein